MKRDKDEAFWKLQRVIAYLWNQEKVDRYALQVIIKAQKQLLERW